MSKFKGTRGKWIITYPEGSNGFVYVGKRINDGTIATCYTVEGSEEDQDITEETKANALLISKAPEMLDMLERIAYGENSPTFSEIIEIIEIIKEATEI